MSRLGLANRHDLLRWADTVGADSELPRLIRRLSLETGIGIVELDFPAGEGVQTRGYDGMVRATRATPFIPEGLSLWEVSVDKSPGKKADGDYDKRVSTPDGRPTTDCTYTAVLLRTWTDRADWAARRTAEGRWKAVRAFGVDDIETWLEHAPVTHAWLSEHFGLTPHGFRSAEWWWRTWSTATTPVLSLGLVLAGRGDAAKVLQSRVGSKAHMTTVSGGSLQEVLAFISATAHGGPLSGDDCLLPRVAFVEDAVAWRRLIDLPNPLVLVPLREELARETPPGHPHHLVVPLVGTQDADIELPPIEPNEAASSLQAAGLDEKTARELGRLARRSLVALRRRLANKREVFTPSWAKPPVERVVRRALLAGRWSDSREGDQAVLSSLTGMSYESLREELGRLKAQEDPLLGLVDGSWFLISPDDAWLVLQRQVRPDDLERFQAAVLEVFGERDPALDLPPEDRWKASLHGKVRVYSSDLRTGLANSLALLGLHGDAVDAGQRSTGANLASYMVRKLLSQANDDPTAHQWSSLSSHLSLFAEAAPDAFLNGVRAGLQGETPVLAGMFADRNEGGPFGPSSPHPELLWALEGLAWSPEYFGQAVDLLARLAEVDSGGRLHNRPINSLIEIYCPWHPGNAVDGKRQLAVYDALRKRHPEIAWRLGIAILPKVHDVHHPTHEPKYRGWKPDKVTVSYSEYFAFISNLVSRLTDDAGVSAERWSELVDHSASLPTNDRERVRTEFARRVSAGEVADHTLFSLWERLRDLIAHHREFADSTWAMPVAELDELAKIAQALVPDDPLERLGWLFKEHSPDLGDYRRRDDYKAYEAVVSDRRRDAIVEIEAAGGLDEVRRLAALSVVPWAVGVALARALGDKYKRELLLMIGPDDSSDVTLALAFMSKRFQEHGWAWLMGVLDHAVDLNALQRGRLLAVTGDFPKAWEVAAAQGYEVAQAFWLHFRIYGLGHDFALVDHAANALIEVGRNAAALHLINLYLRDDGGDTRRRGQLSVRALEGLLQTGEADPEMRGLDGHDLERIFQYLEQQKDELAWEQIARLEWGFLPLLGHEPKADTLHRLLATDPSFFVSIISAMYRPRSGDDHKEPSDEERRIAERGYRLLSSWPTIPGLTDEGRVVGDELRQWVFESLRLLREADRYEVGEIRIGHMLASAPSDPDGNWPCIEVRNLLEELQSDRVEKGLSTEKYNRNGSTSRRLEDDGNREREIAKTYRKQADAYRDQWPRTASVLCELAKSYEHDARRHDEDAERFQSGLDQ